MLITEYNQRAHSAGDLRDIISQVTNMADFYKGMRYFERYVNYINTEKTKDGFISHFKIESERTYRLYDVSFSMDKSGDIIDTKCNCLQFKSLGSCKHVAAALYNSYFEIKDEYIKEPIGDDIISQLFEYLEKNTVKSEVKKELKVEYEITAIVNERYRPEYDICLKMGTDRLYKCKDNRLMNIFSAILNGTSFEVGKNFIFDLNCQYFNEKDKKIIDLLLTFFVDDPYNYGRKSFSFGETNVKRLLKALDGYNYTLNGKELKNFEKRLPCDVNLDKKEGNYQVNFKIEEDYYIVTRDFEFIQNGDTLYHLNKKEMDIFKLALLNDFSNLYFKQSDFDKFSKTLLPIVKRSLNIAPSLENEIIMSTPSTKLYFDIFNDIINCNFKLKYDDKEINYFDSDSSIIRDTDYESGVIADLVDNHFMIMERQISLEGLDYIVNFLEEGLTRLTDKYEVYTSEKLKKTKITTSSVGATFSIGKDNILSYSFDLGDIKEKEIVSILGALRDKKKYYRLKSGDIIDLEKDTDLNELNDLANELDLSNKDILEGTGEIPKYKAIYLDSLKKDKYNIIKTNNLFDELVTKFNTYKDFPLSLTNNDKKMLRGYQVEGVKWLVNITSSGFGGILADEMGLGKSIQAIYYIKELLKRDKSYKFLIVAPTSLVYNWQSEFEKFGSGVKYLVMAGNKLQREELKKDVTGYSVIITTYGLLREDYDFYNELSFETMIIDEAQFIKNANAKVTRSVKGVRANTKIALTGTPIENSVNELWSIFDYMMPGYLGSLQRFSAKYKINDFNEDVNKRISLLTRQIEPFILRRRKKDVIKDLPDKIENNIYTELNKAQKKLYVAELEKVNRAVEEAMNEGGMTKVSFMILSLLTKLRQICIDPKIVYPNYKGGSAKIEQFTEIVKNSVNEGHKILVFTSFRSALEIARGALLKEGISSYVIDGSVSSKKRMVLVDSFNEDDTNVFFIMIKAGGTGLNLTGADVVIHLDLWWNPQVENQATDRAHRIGQKNVVSVVRIICKGTIEERILELQDKKRLLSEKLIDSGSNNSFAKLTEEDIKHLLAYENEE